MTYYLKSGTAFKVTTKESLDLHELLPVGNYVIKSDAFGNLFLEQIESFEISNKLYGDTVRHTGRILSTFADRPASTGVLLNGEKGSGKTLLAKNLAFEAAKNGIPTIVINAPWKGDAFNSLIQSIEQPCVVLFDEFEKVYDSDDQEAILTLLDGVFPSKKLFVLTCNDKWRIDSHMRNRPGRIFYMLDFKGLDADFIREYCNDNLNNKTHIEQIVQIAGTFDQFNFDMLKALIEEMNRFNEAPQDSMRMLNAKPEYSNDSKYRVKIFADGGEIDDNKLDVDEKEWHGNPLTKQVVVSYLVKFKDDDGEEYEDYQQVRFSPSDLKRIENDGTRYVFSNEQGQKATLTKIKDKSFSYWDAF